MQHGAEPVLSAEISSAGHYIDELLVQGGPLSFFSLDLPLLGVPTPCTCSPLYISLDLPLLGLVV